MKRFELVLGQPTGEGAQALVPEAVPFQFARRLGTVVDRVPVPVVLQNRLLSSSMSIAGLLSVPARYALVCSSSGCSIAASVWAIFAAASSSSGKFLGFLGFPRVVLVGAGFPMAGRAHPLVPFRWVVHVVALFAPGASGTFLMP